ncbi:unnamed protein product [Penicillium pancosmium]
MTGVLKQKLVRPYYFVVRNLTTVDISRSFRNTDSNLFTQIPKPITNSTDSVTFLNEGTSWTDGTHIFFYGGLTSYCGGCGGPSSVPPVEAWQYTIADNTWTDTVFGGTPLNARLSEGSSVQSTVTNKAYYISGLMIPEGNPVMSDMKDYNYAVASMLTLNIETKEWANETISRLNEWNTIGEGYTVILDEVGEQGIIVTFGGYTHPHGELARRLAESQGSQNLNSMEYISIYDIASGMWYKQQSTGDIPSWRMAGCSVVVPALDRSSFSIYIFGGMDNTISGSDGNVYVLSIPSFRWIKVYSNSTPRIKHKCELLGKHTMLIIGGNIPTNKGGEFYPMPGNCDATSGTFANGMGIFDLQTHAWRSDYDAEDTEGYKVSSVITSVIGGNQNGSATELEPAHGFNNTNLSTMFKTARKSVNDSVSANDAPTSEGKSSTSSSSLSGGAIAGIVVAVVASVAIFTTWIVFLRKRKKDRRPDYSGEGIQGSSPVSKELVEPDSRQAAAELQDTQAAAELDRASELLELPAEMIHELPQAREKDDYQ